MRRRLGVVCFGANGMKRMSQKLGVIIGVVVVSLGTSNVALGETADAFEERRKAVLAEFDRDGDGRLNATEREAAREGRKEQASGKGRGKGRKREEEPHPPELLAKYDKDKSGWIDGSEWDVAGPAESAKIKKQFDADANDVLDGEEKQAMWGAIRSGKLKGLYAGIAHYFFLREDERKKGSSFVERQRRLLKYDTDGDGLASREELAAIRADRAK